MTVSEIAKKANSAALLLAHLSTDIKNQVLEEMANALEANFDAILSANEKDLQFANKEGIAKQSWNEVEGGATQIIVDPKIVDKYPNSPLEMKLGELLLFSGYLFHRSGNNISDHVRYSLVGMFHDVSYVPFTAPKLNFQYRGITPQNFYNKTFLK